MKGRWFRQYESTMDDPKVQMLSDWLYRAWHTLLCFASKCGGKFPDSLDVLSFVLRRPIDETSETLEKLVGVGLFEKVKDGYRPHNWDEFQYKSDTSTARVKQFRKRYRNVSETPNETPPEQRQSRDRADNKSRAQRFDEFWLVCLRKIGKGAAEKAWFKAVEISGNADLLIARMRRFSELHANDDPKFIPHPATWLNQKRWEDGELQAPTLHATAEEIEAAKDKADRYFKRGKYAENYA